MLTLTPSEHPMVTAIIALFFVQAITFNGKYMYILNTFLFQFSNKKLVIRAGTHKMLVSKANREDPGQTASTVCPVHQETTIQNFSFLSHPDSTQHWLTSGIPGNLKLSSSEL